MAALLSVTLIKFNHPYNLLLLHAVASPDIVTFRYCRASHPSPARRSATPSSITGHYLYFGPLWTVCWRGDSWEPRDSPHPSLRALPEEGRVSVDWGTWVEIFITIKPHRISHKFRHNVQILCQKVIKCTGFRKNLVDEQILSSKFSWWEIRGQKFVFHGTRSKSIRNQSKRSPNFREINCVFIKRVTR